MKMNRKICFVTSLICFLAFSVSNARAQGEGYENYYDVTQPDSNEYNFGGEEEYFPSDDKVKKPEKKPYVRITMPFDTITELITYTEVVVQDESYYDSLYWRTKKFVQHKFNIDEKFFKESMKDMDKIVVVCSMPYFQYKNKYVKESVGTLEFKLTIRFKDGKYKYTIDNFKHILPVNASGRKAEYVYMEYYMRQERNIIYNDQMLRSVNFEMLKLIAELKKALREPAVVDEDDW